MKKGKKLQKEASDSLYSFLVKNINGDDVECCVDPEKYSRWMRLVRIQVWVNRLSRD
jgi:hypothetical protein